MFPLQNIYQGRSLWFTRLLPTIIWTAFFLTIASQPGQSQDLDCARLLFNIQLLVKKDVDSDCDIICEGKFNELEYRLKDNEPFVDICQATNQIAIQGHGGVELRGYYGEPGVDAQQPFDGPQCVCLYTLQMVAYSNQPPPFARACAPADIARRLRFAVDYKQTSDWTVSPPLGIPKSQYFHRLGHHWTTRVPCDFEIPDIPIPVAGSRRYEEQFAFIKTGLPRDVIASMSPFGNSDPPQVMSRSDQLDLYPRITDGTGRRNEQFEPRLLPSLESMLLDLNAPRLHDALHEIHVYVQPRAEETRNEVYHGFQMVTPMMEFASVNDASPSSTWHRGESSRAHAHDDEMEEGSDSKFTLWTEFMSFDPPF